MTSKPNNIRKKALEHAKKGHWDKALEEFLRLVEVEQHNPNLFNEIGDIQLKLANKREAYKQYHAAIAAYEKVGLLNNAVAVCKKILRLNPSDDVVYGRMATLRQSQGFGREAAGYAVQFLDRAMKRPDAADESVRSIVVEIARSVSPEPDVLERAAECLAAWEATNDACDALEKLEKVYRERGMTAEIERTRARIKSLGRDTAAPAGDEGSPRGPDKPQTIETHRPPNGGAAPGFETPLSRTVPSHIRRGHGGDVAADFGVIDVGTPKTRETEESSVPLATGSSGGVAREPVRSGARAEFESDPSVLTTEPVEPPMAPAPETAAGVRIEAEDDEPAPVKEYEIPVEDARRGLEEAFGDEPAERSASSETRAASEVKADVEAVDYRSHYDLGMAYLEMGLLPEAIREFQIAAQSPVFKVRSLEMIGRCFITQNQPDLAIKQLTMGLALVDGDDRAALGIKYSLALAYEMTGESEKARTLFQDVHIVDGTFRDVGEKVRKYAS